MNRKNKGNSDNYFIVLIKIILNTIRNGEEIGFNIYNSKFTIVRELNEDLYVDYFNKKKYKVSVSASDSISTEFIDPHFDFININEYLKDKSKKEQIDFLNSLKMYLSTLLYSNLLVDAKVKREEIINYVIDSNNKIKVKKRGSINEKNIWVRF